MSVSGLHSIEYGVDEWLGHFFMKEVAHGVHEDTLGLLPVQWLFHAFGPERKIEAVLEGVSRDPTKPFGEALRIAEIAAARDLRAARYGIPGRVRPFDLSCCRHGSL